MLIVNWAMIYDLRREVVKGRASLLGVKLVLIQSHLIKKNNNKGTISSYRPYLLRLDSMKPERFV